MWYFKNCTFQEKNCKKFNAELCVKFFFKQIKFTMGDSHQRLFVGNLPPNIKEQELQNEFSAYGTISKKYAKRYVLWLICQSLIAWFLLE